MPDHMLPLPSWFSWIQNMFNCYSNELFLLISYQLKTSSQRLLREEGWYTNIHQSLRPMICDIVLELYGLYLYMISILQLTPCQEDRRCY
ncbi:hypothetical protein TNCV_4495191 [Trichonephila clavipes]|nr:hypothetical protein TNCV_4495191 [Trichonephila clavipes]